MRLKAIYLLFGIFLFGLSGCAVTDFDRSADFSKYKTFGWGKSDIDVSSPVYDSELINKRIRRTVEEEFAKRGIQKSAEDPDFIVRYHTFTEEKERTSGGHPYAYRYFPYGFYPFAFGWGYPYYWMTPPRTTEYTEGTLVLDIIDNRSDELVWRGTVTGEVEDLASLRKKIEKGVKAIIKKYPATPGTPLNIGGDENVVS